MQPEQKTRRLALIASVLLHVGLLAWVASLRAPSPAAQPELRPELVELEVLENGIPPAEPVEREASAAEPPPRAPAPRTASKPDRPPGHSPGRASTAVKPGETAPVATASAGAAAAEVAATTTGEPELAGAAGPIADRPARLSGGEVSLAPTTETARGLGFGTLDGPGLGTTLRATDGKDAKGDRAREARVVEERVQAMLEDAQARDRVQTGAVDDYFAGMRRALAEQTAKPPPGRDLANPVGAAVKSWVGGMERFGATGNPYREAEAEGAGSGAVTTSIDEKVRRGQEFFEGAFGSEMVAIVEIRQTGDGGLSDWRLLASSGLREFDAYVMGAVPQAIGSLAPAPSSGAGLHADGLRSLWAFEGRIQYRTPIKGETNGDTATNALYLVLGGSFEETTGEVWVNRIDKPQFVCRVRMLAVY